ncbi:ThiJ PfpI family protein [Aspergillus sclerotialis]|uniref:ThiJ PfpI family protein n=1 Tax=Aspergillus sclerotialis TaxID=2070753 RepID=A0A3A2Z6L2_9EURO|nr:ThiJ PfpI family protein [Aspergillus sclerotialis]
MSSPKHYYKVGILLFNGVDILDFAGPIEILSHVSHNGNPDAPDRMFEIVTIGQTNAIRAAGSLTIQTDILLEEARGKLSEYDILLVPGAPPAIVKPLIDSNSPELDIIREYATLPSPNVHGKRRLLFSVCMGAILLGAAGILEGVTVTTHHRGLDLLRETTSRANGNSQLPIEVVQKRYIDGGVLKSGVELLTAGGISCGLDATLHLVKNLVSVDMAAFVARLMEYNWR